MKRIFTGMTLALGLMAGAAMAQDTGTAGTMDVGLSMLELSAQKVLGQYNLEGVSAMDLNLSQLAEIKRIIGDDSVAEGEKKVAIEAAIRR